MLLLSHRGSTGRHAENTLAAFEDALRLGVDGIETDVRLTADGHVVLFHDRIASDGSPVGSLSHAALDRVAGFAVPRLEDALLAFPSTLWMLEVKAPEAAAAVERALRTRPPSLRLLVTSFHHPLALALSRRLGVEGGVIVAHAPLGAEGVPFGLPARAGGVATLVWAWDTLDTEAVGRANAAGYRSFVYGVETPEEHLAAIRLPLAGVVTDHPDRFPRPLA